MTRTKALVNNLLMSNLQQKSNLDYKSYTIEIVILNTKWKDCKSLLLTQKDLRTQNYHCEFIKNLLSEKRKENM